MTALSFVWVHPYSQNSRCDKTYAYENPNIITTMPQVRIEAADLIMVRVETNNLEGLYHKIEVKDLNIASVSFRITAIREVHHNEIVHNMVAHVSHIFRGTK